MASVLQHESLMHYYQTIGCPACPGVLQSPLKQAPISGLSIIAKDLTVKQWVFSSPILYENSAKL